MLFDIEFPKKLDEEEKELLSSVIFVEKQEYMTSTRIVEYGAWYMLGLYC